MAVPQKAAELHPSSIFTTVDPILWVPTDFAEGDTNIYVIAANHRGDMYHLRGAMTLVSHPLLVYKCADETTELTDYLKKPLLPNNYFLTRWTWDMLIDPNFKPGPGYSRRTFKTYSESMATTIIKDNVKNEADMTKLAEGMAFIDKDDKEGLKTEFKQLCVKLFKYSPIDPRTTILVQYRDTGTKGGIYPELDSSDASIVQIAEYIRDASKKSTKSLNVELCGNAKQIDDLHSIGEYFKQINPQRWPKNTKRDLETFFLKVAFQEGYFKMALGFRSGGLDVFTFLGVPSISISIRQLVGETRHREIAANPFFKRLNIQYELPRHISTKYTAKDNLLGSPWWLFAGKDHPKPTDQERAQQSISPSGFHDFDGSIMEIGIYHAIVVLLNLDIQPTIKPQGVAQVRVFDNKVCRTCYYSDMDFRKGEIFNFQTSQKAREVIDFKTREDTMGYREEPKKDFEKWKKAMEDDWKKILKPPPSPSWYSYFFPFSH
jgi:hypothetical protein